MEELYECDVLWPEHQNNDEITASNCSNVYHEKMKISKSSAPLSIPAARRSCGREYIDNEAAEAELVPPHVLVSQSRSGEKVEFSVCSGQGRTLKGRDLRYVRDSVLRMTGFLEG